MRRNFACIGWSCTKWKWVMRLSKSYEPEQGMNWNRAQAIFRAQAISRGV